MMHMPETFIERARPNTVAIAAAMLAVNGITSLVQGVAGDLPPGTEAIPQVVIAVGVATTLLGLAAAYGLWMLRRWGFVLTLIVCVVSIVSAVPGLFIAPNRTLWASAIAGILVYAFILALVLLAPSRRAFRDAPDH
jgi:hypothetical protein